MTAGKVCALTQGGQWGNDSDVELGGSVVNRECKLAAIAASGSVGLMSAP
jgi:hypothetical protein